MKQSKKQESQCVESSCMLVYIITTIHSTPLPSPSLSSFNNSSIVIGHGHRKSFLSKEGQFVVSQFSQ